MQTSRNNRNARAKRLGALISACSLVLCGCSDPDARVEGVFVLDSIDGQSLPFSYDVPARILTPAYNVVMLADTLELRSNGTGDSRGLSRQRSLPDGDAREMPSYTSFAHRSDGRQVVLDSLECRPNSNDPYVVCVVSESTITYSVVDGGLERREQGARWFWRRVGQ